MSSLYKNELTVGKRYLQLKIKFLPLFKILISLKYFSPAGQDL